MIVSLTDFSTGLGMKQGAFLRSGLPASWSCSMLAQGEGSWGEEEGEAVVCVSVC